MIIFGFGKTTFKDMGADRPVTCERCHNQVQYQFAERRKWFTLFFIPVIPYEKQLMVICPVCRNALVLPKDVWEQRRRDAGLV